MTRKRVLEDLIALQRSRTFGLSNWLPEFHRLPGAPQLLPGEALSSWCWRMATSLRVSIKEVTRLMGFSEPIFLADVGSVVLDISRISNLVSQAPEQLEHLHWPSHSGLAAKTLTYLSVVPLEQRPLFRYCENCLRVDQTPFIRQFWRWGFAYVCPTHGSTLRDACPHCSKPFFWKGTSPPLKVDTVKLSICVHCGEDICRVLSNYLPVSLRCSVLSQQMAMTLQLYKEPSRLEAVMGVGEEHGEGWVRSQGVIDVTCEKSVTTLFMSVMSNSLAGVGAEKVTRAASLDWYLTKTSKRHQYELSDVVLGLDAWLVFGADAAVLPSHLHAGGCTWSGTHWFSLDATNITGRLLTEEIWATGLWLKSLELFFRSDNAVSS